MKPEIWQTTNQQPWVYALSHGIITAKTRMSQPCVPVGSLVFLHASKSRLWKYWQGLKWASEIDPKDFERGTIEAVAVVEKVDWSDLVLKKGEYKYWDVYENGNFVYNSVGQYAIRFKNITPLKVPVAAKGFQAPFARAKEETVKRVLKSNPELKSYLCHS